MQAKPGKEREVETFLESAEPLAQQEAGTVAWYAVKLGPARYGIFDTFQNEEGRNAHLTGEIAKALFAKAEELFAAPPQVERLEILAVKGSIRLNGALSTQTDIRPDLRPDRRCYAPFHVCIGREHFSWPAILPGRIGLPLILLRRARRSSRVGALAQPWRPQAGIATSRQLKIGGATLQD